MNLRVEDEKAKMTEWWPVWRGVLSRYCQKRRKEIRGQNDDESVSSTETLTRFWCLYLQASPSGRSLREGERARGGESVEFGFWISFSLTESLELVLETTSDLWSSGYFGLGCLGFEPAHKNILVATINSRKTFFLFLFIFSHYGDLEWSNCKI